MAQEIAALQVVIEAQTAAFTKGIQDAQNQLQKLNTVAQNSNSGINKIAESFGGLQGAFFKFNQATAAVSTGIALVGTAAKKLESFFYAADASKKFERVLTELTGSAPRAADMLKRIYDVADQGDLSMSQAKDSIQRMVEATRELGLSNKQIAGLTTTFYQLGKIGGKSAEEMSGAFQQFALAMQRGEISTGQLMRMLRTSPGLVKNLGDALGVSSQGLQNMAKEGKLTADVIVKAFEKMGPEVAAKVEAMPKTVAEGFEALGRVFDKFSVDLAKAFNFSEISVSIGKPLIDLADKLNNEILPNIIAFAKDISKNMEYVKAAILGLGIAFAGPLVTGILAATKAAMAFAVTPVGAILTFAAAVVALAANWKEIRTELNRARIALLEFMAAAASKVGMKETADNLRSMANAVKELQAGYDKADAEEKAKKVATGIKDVGDEANAAIPRMNAFDEAWKSWLESLKKARLEIDQTPRKLAELQSQLSALEKITNKSATDIVWIEKLKKDIEGLKTQMAAGNPLQLLYLEMEKLGGDVGLSAEQKMEGILTKMREMAQAGTLTSEGFKKLAKALEEATKAENIERMGPVLASLNEQIAAQGREFDAVAEKIAFVQEKIRALVDQGIPEDNQMLKYLRNMSEEMTKTKDSGVKDFLELRDAVAGFSQQFAGQFVDNLLQGKIAFDDFAKGLLNTIVKTMMNQMVTKFITSFMGGGGTSFGSSFLGGLFGKNAVGNAFQSGTGLPYGIYDKPTFFQMNTPIQKFAKGGVLGEAGPEAIMPLTRGRDGKLGVEATGGSTVINVINNAGVEVQTAEKTGDDGSKIIDIMIERKVKDMFSSGAMDKQMRVGYGLSRAAS